ncbi:hypothetical protein BGY98DRAFT_999615, partial [Russula aff. rugulosa BPL654]
MIPSISKTLAVCRLAALTGGECLVQDHIPALDSSTVVPQKRSSAQQQRSCIHQLTCAPSFLAL